MSWSPRERAMLQEMGVAWPEQTNPRTAPASPVAPAPVVTAPVTPLAQVRPEAVEQAPGASVGDVATLDWSDLQHQVSQCKRCGLCSTRRKTVFGVGHPRAHWMVVGEAPGEQEDRQGEPFVGAAGQLLDRMLTSIGLDRTGPDDRDAQGDPSARVFITNTVKCRPPQNRNPQPEELAACAPFLARQMALVQPRIVLAMGRFAAQQLLNTDQPIGRLRGQVHMLPGPQPVPVVVTYHPAYLLRNPVDKAKAWDDLCLALDTAQASR